MKNDRLCITCGTSLDVHVAGAVCAACLLEAGLSGKDPEPLDLRVDGEVEVFGDYELIKVLAYGGMGIVYQARQISLDRSVAVKMLFAGPRASEELIQRFQREAAAIAKLSHPNIVCIFEVGEEGGQHFFSMEYVEGRSLAERMRDHPVSIQQAATYVRTISRAIHYAHQQGILHRDLKPSNILIDLNDEVRVTDFGLAKQIGQDSDLTLTGQVLGSPNYFPPEQASGQHGKLGPYSDVYSIGAILYQLLTGRPPFLSDSVQETLVQIRDQDLVSPRLLNPKLPRDLETICLKCLEKEPSNRYQNAGDLADELDRFLEGKPIRSRPVSAPVKLMRWTMRRPALAAIWMLLFLGVLTTSWQWRRAETNAALTQKHLYIADMNLAFAAFEKGNRGRVRDLLERHRPKGNGPDFRDWEWRWLWGQTQNKNDIDLGHHSAIVQSVVFAPDGKRAASRSLDGFTQIWDIESRRLSVKLENGTTQGYFHNLAWIDHGNVLAGFDRSERLRTWEGPDYKPCIWDELPFFPEIIAFSPDETTLAIGGQTGWGLRSWPDMAKEKFIVTKRARVSHPYQVAFSPDGRWIAGCDYERRIILLNADNWLEVARIEPEFSSTINFLDFSDDGRYLASAAGTKFMVLDLSDISSGKQPAVIHTHDAIFKDWKDGKFSPDGHLLYLASDDTRIHVIECENWSEIGILSGHVSPVTSIDVSHDGRYLISGGRDGELKLWSTEQSLLESGRKTFDSMLLSEGSTGGRKRYRMSLVDDASRIEIWDGTALRKVRSFPNPIDLEGTHGEGKALSKDGSMIAFADASGRVSVLNAEDGSIRFTTQSYPHDWSAIAFSADGRYVVHKDQFSGNPLRFLDTDSGGNVFELDIGLESWMAKPAFSSNGAWMAVTDVGYEMQVWDLKARRKLFTAPKFVYQIEFSESNMEVYCCSGGNELNCYSIPDGELKWSINPRMSNFRSVAVSNSGKRLFLGGSHGQLMILDRETLQPVGNLDASETNCGISDIYIEEDQNSIVGHGYMTLRWNAPAWEEIP